MSCEEAEASVRRAELRVLAGGWREEPLLRAVRLGKSAATSYVEAGEPAPLVTVDLLLSYWLTALGEHEEALRHATRAARLAKAHAEWERKRANEAVREAEARMRGELLPPRMVERALPHIGSRRWDALAPPRTLERIEPCAACSACYFSGSGP